MPISRTSVLKKTTISLLVASTPVLAQAAIYRYEVQADLTPQTASFGYVAPFNGLSGSFNILAIFFVDDQTGTLFGDPSCGGYGMSYSYCGAYGYEISDLVVKINGIESPNWVAGVNSSTFFGESIDMKGKSIFGSQGIPGGDKLWLPLINVVSPFASINFGQLYVSLGGMAFTPPWAIATNEIGEKAIGLTNAKLDEYQSISPSSTVPEPSSALLLMSGLGLAGHHLRNSKTPKARQLSRPSISHRPP